MNQLDFVWQWHPAMLFLRDWYAEKYPAFPWLQKLIIDLNEELIRLDDVSSFPPEHTGRKDDMSPGDRLELLREEDGDWIVTIIRHDADGIVMDRPSVQFCTPGSGGGGSPLTFCALCLLATAMEFDNRNPNTSNRALPQ